MKLVKEFKEFILRGNVIDMAVAVVIGAAFTAIVNSLVNDIINPIIGYYLAGVDFSHFKIVLKAASEGQAEVAIAYGMLINAIIKFLIVGLVFFLLLKVISKTFNRAEKAKLAAKEAEAAAKAVERSESLAKFENMETKELLANILFELSKK